MSSNVCPNCGKIQEWYEPKKYDPITKLQICRKCGSPINLPKNAANDSKNDSINITKDPAIKRLVLDIVASFNEIRNKINEIVFPSIPLLYLGDLDKYLNSNLRIITVGPNPSYSEFPQDDSFLRFREIEKFGTRQDKAMTVYLKGLNNYFAENPDKVHESYIPILDGFDANYYPKAQNTALQTYFCSPIATNVSWGKLKSSAKFTLSREGRDFWNKLVNILKPDIILFSIDKEYLNRVSIKNPGWEVFKRINLKTDGTPRAKPYLIETSEGKLDSNKVLLVYGKPSYLPFGSISYKDKQQLGIDLREMFEAGSL